MSYVTSQFGNEDFDVGVDNIDDAELCVRREVITRRAFNMMIVFKSSTN